MVLLVYYQLVVVSLTGGSFGGLPLAAIFDLSLTSAPLASNIRATAKDNAVCTSGVLSLCPAVGSDSERKYLAALTGTEEKVLTVAKEGEVAEEVLAVAKEGEVAEEVAKEEFAIAREDSAKEFAVAREDSAKEELAAVKRVDIRVQEEFTTVTVAKRVGIRVHFDPSTNFRQKVFKNSPVPHLRTFVKSVMQTTKTSRIVPTGPNLGCSSSQTAPPSWIPAPLSTFKSAM